jgi:hypothetical protein
VENHTPPEKVGVTGDTDRREIGVRPKEIAQRNQSADPRNIFLLRGNKRLREARLGTEGNADGGPPGARRAAAHAAGEAGLWREVEASLSPAEQAATLREVYADVRPSAALLAYQAALQARGRVA